MERISAQIAEVRLGHTLVGYLTHYRDGVSTFVFDEAYIDLGPRRPVLSQFFVFPHDEDRTVKKLQGIYKSQQRLPPFFANLLPEGALRSLMMGRLGLREHEEFQLLLAVGEDLPGKVGVRAVAQAPDRVLAARRSVVVRPESTINAPLTFSLAGVQLKFSMMQSGKRWTLPHVEERGRFIVKLPSTVHPQLARVEYISMKLAQAIGVETPLIALVRRDALVGLPTLNMPDEPEAYVIERFDRTRDSAVHMEDFAQIFGLRPQEKYNHVNYDMMVRLMLDVLPHGLENVEQFLRRLVTHLQLGNSDAHLKNWSLLYPDGTAPRLSPSYDVLSTLAYHADRNMALNIGREREFYTINDATWERFARHTQLDKRFVLQTVRETTQRARDLWPKLMREFEAPTFLREAIVDHWKKLR